jgi:PST family polysaccharide transporter
MFRLLLLISLPGLVIGVVAGEPLIRILFGSKWQAVAPVFSWLCLGSMLTPLNTAIFWLFVSQGRARDQMIYGTAAALINMATYVIGIHWGLLGVARTSAIAAFIVTSPVLVLAACRKGPIDMRSICMSLYPAILSALVAATILELYARFAHIVSVMDLLFLVILAYGAMLLVLSGFSTGRATLQEAVAVFRSFKEQRGG